MRRLLARLLGITPEIRVLEVVPTNRQELIRLALLQGWELTPDDARHRWGIESLASYISILRREGLDIETVPVRRYGRRASLYRLVSAQ